jgi:hypothetical protein
LAALGAWVVNLTVFLSPADPAAPAAKPDETYTGTVLSVDPKGRTLDLKAFLFTKKFQLGDKCAYALCDKPEGAITDLRPGEKVTVFYQDASGVLVADRIKQEPMTEAGMIRAMDPMAHTLTLYSGRSDKTFQIPKHCQVRLQGGKAGVLTNLEPGYTVNVTYGLPQDQPVAREIVQTGMTFVGKLTAVDIGSRTVKAQSPFATKQFNLADNCVLLINDRLETHLSDLKLGEQLTFSYNDIDGIYVAHSIASEPVSPQHASTSVRPTLSYPPRYPIP